MRNIHATLTQEQAQALINLIVTEQGMITKYGDPARYNHSDMQFFNVLEGLLVRSLAEVKLVDQDEEARNEPRRK